MSEKKTAYIDVELLAPHTNRRVPYVKGNVLRLREDQAKRLLEAKGAKPAAQGAQPLNVKETGASA